MPLPVIAGVVRCSARGLLASGQPWVNVLHCQYAGGASNPGATEIAALHTNLQRLWKGPVFGAGAHWLANCQSTVTMIDITYYPLDGSSLGVVLAAAAAGTSTTTDNLPAQTCSVLTLRTNTRGRRYRGRIYLPPVVEGSSTANGELLLSKTTEIIAQWTGMASAMAATQWVPVVASYGRSELKNGTVSTWSPFATPITSVTMDVKFDVQRRRK